MAAVAPAVDSSVAAPPASRWIASPAFDTMVFASAPLLGFVFLAMMLKGVAAVPAGLAFFALGMAHYFSTFTFFLGDENLAYSRTRPLAYFAGPVVILGAVATLRFGAGLNVLLTAIFLWNAWHVTLQSCGIASVYRHRAGGDPAEKRPVNFALISLNGALVAYTIPRFPPLDTLLRAAWEQLPLVLMWTAAACAAAGFAYLAVDVVRRIRVGRRFSMAETVFLVSSFLLFHPYAWVENSEIATAGMLIGHFVQYLGLIWLLNRRKYAHARGSLLQNALSIASRRPVIAGAFLLAAAVAWFLADRVASRFGARQIYFWAWNALVLMHFYLDGLIWSFKNPFVRSTIGPYLSRGGQGVTAPAAPLEQVA